MKKIYAILLITTVGLTTNAATTWKVGPTQTYTKPSSVSSLVQSGDTVEIDAGTYMADVAYWNVDNLTLRGVGGMAHLNANNTALSRKAIWIIAGKNTTVENIEFSNCHDVSGNDANWAGIRMEGTNLTVKNCYFHDNDDGILESNVAGSNIDISYTEFNHNGFGDGYSHNLYIGHCAKLTFSYNYSHMAQIGHELKSRAAVNYVLYNRIGNENGTASYEVSFPNGGLAVVMGNMIEQGPNTDNNVIVDYGSEGASNPGPLEFYVINNTIVNDRPSGGYFIKVNGASLCKSYNNLLAGNGVNMTATSTTVDSTNNWNVATISDAGLVNASGFDYHLLSTSQAIDKGASVGTTSAQAGSFGLTPLYEYKHAVNKTVRTVSGPIDLGAYEYVSPTGITVTEKPKSEMYTYVDFYDSGINIFFTNTNCNKDVYIYDMSGKLVAAQERSASSKITFEKGAIGAGVYVVRARIGDELLSKKLIVQ